MNILLCFDNSYSPYAATTIVSFCMNNEGHHIFYVITDGIDEVNTLRLLRLVSRFNSELKILLVNESEFQNFPIGAETASTYIKLPTYFRLFLLKLLPKDIDKLIYLDCDIIVNGNIRPLWEMEFPSEVVLMAVEDDVSTARKAPLRLGYDPKFSYFNAGVLFLSVCKIRRCISHDEILEYIKINRAKIKLHDQDILNALFFNRKQFIPMKYNVLDTNYEKYHKINPRYKGETEAINHPIVIHYSGPIKPWHKECIHPYKNIFFQYAKCVPFEIIPKNKFNDSYDKFLFTTRRYVSLVFRCLRFI